MNEVSEFLKMGFFHIIDRSSMDHLLFIAALTIGYGRGQMNKLLLIFTAFTIGHAITLGLTVTDHLFLEEKYVEFLIPLTIVITGIYHLMNLTSKKRKMIWIYLITIVFGLIHGMGYASSFKSMFSSGQGLWAPLLEFNLGVEAGQVLAGFIVFKASRLIKRITGISDRMIKAFTAGVVISLGLMLLWENRFW